MTNFAVKKIIMLRYKNDWKVKYLFVATKHRKLLADDFVKEKGPADFNKAALSLVKKK